MWLLDIGGSIEDLHRGAVAWGWLLDRSDGCSRTSRSPVGLILAFQSLRATLGYCVALTIRVTFQERIEHLQVTGNLLASPPLASNLQNIFGNQLVSTI